MSWFFPTVIVVHVFGRTPMLYTKPPAQKGAVQISPVQKNSCDFQPLKIDGRADVNQEKPSLSEHENHVLR